MYINYHLNYHLIISIRGTPKILSQVDALKLLTDPRGKPWPDLACPGTSAACDARFLNRDVQPAEMATSPPKIAGKMGISWGFYGDFMVISATIGI